jgi:hypothetical protein
MAKEPVVMMDTETNFSIKDMANKIQAELYWTKSSLEWCRLGYIIPNISYSGRR